MDRAALAQVSVTDDPSRLGIATGDPQPDGFVIWTRLAPKPFKIGFGMDTRPRGAALRPGDGWRSWRQRRRAQISVREGRLAQVLRRREGSVELQPRPDHVVDPPDRNEDHAAQPAVDRQQVHLIE